MLGLTSETPEGVAVIFVEQRESGCEGTEFAVFDEEQGHQSVTCET